MRKAPGTFAEVARKNSQDTGSAPSGGDLGFFKRGDMVKPFEDAAFSMKKGDISDLVESEYGYHIIQLNDVKTPRQPTFEEVRAKLETEAKQQQAQRKFAELAEVFSNTVYEQADSLQPVADKLKLKVQTASGVARTPLPGAQGPLANGRFLEALFAADSVQNKRNTEAIETAPSTLVAGRVAAYTPASTPAFDQVKARVRELFVADRSAELARKEGEARLAAWKAAPASATGLGNLVTISRDKPEGQPRPVVDAALQVNADTLPAFAGTPWRPGLRRRQGDPHRAARPVGPGRGPPAASAVRRSRGPGRGHGLLRTAQGSLQGPVQGGPPDGRRHPRRGKLML